MQSSVFDFSALLPHPSPTTNCYDFPLPVSRRSIPPVARQPGLCTTAFATAVLPARASVLPALHAPRTAAVAAAHAPVWADHVYFVHPAVLDDDYAAGSATAAGSGRSVRASGARYGSAGAQARRENDAVKNVRKRRKKSSPLSGNFSRTT